MTTCDNDHEPIQFNSPFTALCPLCALKREMAQALEQMEEQAQEAQEIHDQQVNSLEGKLLMEREKVDKLEDERDGWKARAEELEKKLEGK